MKTIFQTLALSFLAVTICVPAVMAQDEVPETPTENKASNKKTNAMNQQPSFVVRFNKGDVWEVNYPTILYPRAERKTVYRNKKLATVKQDNRGILITRTETTDDGLSFEKNHRMSEIVKFEWPEKDPRIDLARNELMRGNVARSLEIVETFLNFFNPYKSVEGSPWIRAAVIKLAALDQQQNDISLNSFITEIKLTPGWTDIEGLPMQIKMAELNQMMRREEYKQVLRSADEMMKGQNDTELLARLHLIKGNALYALKDYEDALKIYLRVPVFYGNQAIYVPAAKLAVARCFKRMNRPEYAAMNLDKQSDVYLEEVITEYPMSVEAKAALAELPKHKRDAMLAKGSIEEQAAKRAEITSQIEIESDSEDGDYSGGDSSSDDYGDDDYVSDDSDYE